MDKNVWNKIVKLLKLSTKRMEKPKYPEMDISTLSCSVLILEPKPAFFSWLTTILENRTPKSNLSSKMLLNTVYFPEENRVWLIPPIPNFYSNETLQTYLCSLKCKLLRRTLADFVMSKDEFPLRMDEFTFDEFFELKLYDKVWDIRSLT